MYFGEKEILWVLHYHYIYGELYGLFKATKNQINNLINNRKYVYFRDANGTYSDIKGPLENFDVSIFSEDDYIIKNVKTFGYMPV